MSKKLIRFDWAMKKLLRDKANFDVLEGFLCALLDDENIQILNILESETNQDDVEDKFNRVDLLIQDSEKRKIYIEIQNTRETDYLESLLFATSKIIVEHQNLGDNFKDISKVISVSILYFNLGIGDDYIYYGTNEFIGLNSREKLILKKRKNVSESLEPKYKFVEKNIFPEYYLITVERYQNIVRKKIDEWIYMIKNNEVADGSSSKNIDKAKQKLAEINMTDAERKSYERYLINLAKDEDVVNTAKEEGRQEGHQEGRQEGRQEGEIIGMNKKAKTTALKLIRKGMSNEEISEITDLTIFEIDEIRNELKDNSD